MAGAAKVALNHTPWAFIDSSPWEDVDVKLIKEILNATEVSLAGLLPPSLWPGDQSMIYGMSIDRLKTSIDASEPDYRPKISNIKATRR